MRLAAAAGFADMTSATNFIAAKFADMMRSKIFAKNVDNNSDEIKGYFNLIKSFNLKYDPQKNQPDRDMIIRKFTGR